MRQKSESSRLTSRRKKKGWWWKRLLKWLVILTIVGVIGGAILVYVMIWPLLQDLPSPDDLTTGNERFNVATQIFDRNGNKLYDLYDDERRVPMKLTDLPIYVGQASVAIEDKKFYDHHGFDPIGIVRAFLVNQTRGELAQGGSTITQQLMKKAFLTDEKSYDRKIKEIALAVVSEMRYSKEQILEMYLNYISYGGTAVGIGSAAETYFDKEASELTLAEAALLAGLPQAPSRYSPFQSDATAAKNRQKEVLKNMVELGYITQEQADKAASEELNFVRRKIEIKAPHFVFYVRDELVKEFGEDKVLRGGLRVTTSLDLALQETAQASLSAELADLEKLDVGNGAALVTKPDTGEILAMIGSKDYFDEEHDGQFNVTTAKRQPGSSIKPLVYATAFEQKALNPASVLLDVPTCFQLIGQPDYCPKNYSGNFNGATSVRQALGSSLNIPAVKALRIVGLESFLYQAQKMGLTTLQEAKNYGPALALGGGEVRMVDMATAFGALANEGVKVPLTAILKVEDYQGNVLLEVKPEQRQEWLAQMQANPEVSFEDGERKEIDSDDLTRVLNPEPAYLVTEIMRDDQARWLGFGSRSELVVKDKEVAVKTGTTNDVKDNWTVGFTPDFLTIVWVGNTDNSAMNSRLVSGVTGAAPIWNQIMSFILQNQEVNWEEPPETIKQADVCWTGLPRREADLSADQIQTDEAGNQVIKDSCGEMKRDWYWTDGFPTRSGIRQEAVHVCVSTGLPPKVNKDTGEVEDCGEMTAGDFQIAQDPLLDYYCVNCPRPVNPETGKVVTEEGYYVAETEGARQYGD